MYYNTTTTYRCKFQNVETVENVFKYTRNVKKRCKEVKIDEGY